MVSILNALCLALDSEYFLLVFEMFYGFMFYT